MIYDLALILVVATIVALLFKRLNQPIVLGYIVAGFLVSPHMPYLASVANVENIHTWADIGVMFLMFALGLEFSFKKIVNMGMAPIIAAVSIIFSMMTLGVVIGHAFGWARMDCIFLGGMLSMSSTTIIYKAYDDLGLTHRHFASLVLSVLILEDVLAIVMMVMLSAVATGGDGGGGAMLMGVMKIVFFIVLWFVVGLFVIPRLLRSVRSLLNGETLLVLALGLCCGMAVLSEQVGFSSAFGAFVMGSILAETIEAEKIEHLVEPVKNLFGAIFFVSVGMLVEPAIIVEYALPIIGLVLTILLGQAVFGSVGYLFSGQTLKNALHCGFSMAQIGEFSFIIATMGLSLGVISSFLYPVIVAVSVVTIFLTPYMIRAAEPAYAVIERRLPKVWIKRLNRVGMQTSTDKHATTIWRTLMRQIAINTLIFTILSIAVVAVSQLFFEPLLRRFLPKMWADAVYCVVTIMAVAPFLRSIVMKKTLSDAVRQLWTESFINRLPIVFTVIVRAVIAMAVVFYIVHHVYLFTSALVLCLALVVIIAVLASSKLKKNNLRLERIFIENLRSREIAAQVSGKRRPLFENRLLDRSLHISEVTVPAESEWAGKSIGQLSLGQRFGVHVSSILRGSHRINIPGADSILFPLDRLSLIGSDEQLAALSSALRSEVVAEDFNIEKREMKLRQITLSADNPLVGKPLLSAGLREHYGVMLVGIDEGQTNLTHVDPSHVFVAGDRLWVVGEKDKLDKLEAEV